MLTHESGIHPDFIAARGYQTVTSQTDLKRLGFAQKQCNVPALLIPVISPTGEQRLYQVRPDTPRINDEGKPVKYETPSGSQMSLDMHPSVRDKATDPKTPLWTTEGIKKGDALATHGLCAVALIGVWNFRGTNEHGGKTALPEWEFIALNGRDVYIVFDSDVMTKQAVHAALVRLKAMLEHRGAKVKLIYLPDAADGSKQGVDDYLVAGHSVQDLLALATPTLRNFNREEESGKEPRKSQATELGELVQKSGAELFHTPDDEPFITVLVKGHSETYRLRSKGARAWLRRLYHTEAGKSIGGQALQDVLNDLEGTALFDGEEHKVHVRLAWHEGDIILDLGDPIHQVVRVTRSGWHLEAHSPVKFVRPKALAALPVPVMGGSVAELWNLLNIEVKDQPLVTAWLVAALRPSGPYPLLALHGEQGSAKSTTARVLRALVDPNTAPLRSEPKTPQDLMIAAISSWVPTFDNLSSISQNLSDAFCILATGGGHAGRALYADDEEAILKAQRPVIMTAINDIATRPDLLDRCIILYLPRIKTGQRQLESVFWIMFSDAHARILGALLTAVSSGLRNVEHVTLAELPRMADFAVWAVACEEALGFNAGGFMDRYSANREDANEFALDTSPLPPVLRAFLAAQGGVWQGSASELLNGLNDHLRKVGDERTSKLREWPKRADKLSGTLRRYAPNLRATGFELDFERTNKQRLISLRFEPHSSVTSVTGDTNAVRDSSTDKRVDDANFGQNQVGVTEQGSVTSGVATNKASARREQSKPNAGDASDAPQRDVSKWSVEL